jgi:hypothetical protein
VEDLRTFSIVFSVILSVLGGVLFATWAFVGWAEHRFRFRVGTLLVTMTLVAVGLGIIAWLSRAS